MRALTTTALTAAVCVFLAAGTAEAQTKRCVSNCLAPYANAASSVQNEVRPKCRAACNIAKPRRQTCQNLVAVAFKDLTKTCTASLKRIKRGQPPLSIVVPIAHRHDGNVTDPEGIYYFDQDCMKDIKRHRNRDMIACQQILCPPNQYWDSAGGGCITNPNNIPSNEVPLNVVTPLPTVIRGFYKWSWTKSDPYQGPLDTNVGVTFTGWVASPATASSANIPPVTTAPIKWLSYGGGNANGAWDLSRVQYTGSQTNLNNVVSLGYSGIVLDLEEYLPGQTVSISDWNTLFAAIKAANLNCIVTISHFVPYGMANGQELVNSMLKNPNIDVLSPQLYTSGYETQNDWSGYSDAWRSTVPIVAPSIVQASYYSQVGANSVTSYLPNARGYFVWANTPPQPSPPSCVSGYFPGSGCSYMCSWCKQQLGTTNIYWTTSICTDDGVGGCKGSPLAGVQYTCCRAG